MKIMTKPKLTILGSSNAVPNERQENTHMALVLPSSNEVGQRTILIDCVGNPILRLQQAGIALDSITDLILTHFHPDHVSGAPLLLMNAWLLGRKAPLMLHGLSHTLERFKQLMDFYDWGSWPNFYDCIFYPIPKREMHPVISERDLKIYASPVQHIIPTVGLRIEWGEMVLAYSCDTEPHPNVERLAAGADILIHEATGAIFGHSSAAQAGEIARRAAVGKLYLIHYHGGDDVNPRLVAEAQTAFGGPTDLATDFMEIPMK
jgi:ribonuclease Z